jgi:hypothetical protein
MKKMFATCIDKDALKSLKLLSINAERPINALLEEALQDLLKNYDKQDKKTKK